MSSQSYKDLLVWKKSIQLVKEIYTLTENFPKSEKFGLVDQLRRASVSIPSNIAEGYGRSSSKERYQFISLSRGSASEVETQLIVAKEINLLGEESFNKLEKQNSEILRMLVGLQKSLTSN